MKIDLLKIYRENKAGVWISSILAAIFILAAGSVYFPEIFWDPFLWKYYWGPVVSDAGGETYGDVSQGYNVVNTLTYGIVLVIAMKGIHEIINYYEVEVDKGFVLSLIPWIILGGSFRTLEDIGLFPDHLRPFFISPVIYFVLGISAVLTLILGRHLLLKEREDILLRGAVMSPPLIAFLILQLKFFTIMFFVLFGIVAFFFFAGIVRERMDEKYLFVTYGGSLAIVSLIYNVYFMLTESGAHPWESQIIPLTAAGLVVGFLLTTKVFDNLVDKDVSYFFIFTQPLNFLILFSHIFDASATFRGMEYYGYVEKHVLPTAMIELTGTPAVMFVLKFLLVVLIVYTLDVLYKDELDEIPQIKNLVKFVVIVLGLAPAVRNTLRLAMGV